MSKFAYAIAGLLQGLRDRSILLQWTIALIAAGFFWWLKITQLEWCLFIICCGLVLVSEYFNTVVEHIMDFQHNRFHPDIQRIKDMSAGAVLVSAMMALAVGVMIAWKYLMI